MGDQIAMGIDPAFALFEMQARNAQGVDVVLLPWRQVAAQIDEGFGPLDAGAHVVGIHVGQGGGQLLRRLGHVDTGFDHVLRTGVQRHGGQAGGQHGAIAVGDVGPAHFQVLGPGLGQRARLGRIAVEDGDIDHASADDAEDGQENQGGDQQAGAAGLDGARAHTIQAQGAGVVLQVFARMDAGVIGGAGKQAHRMSPTLGLVSAKAGAGRAGGLGMAATEA